jgi:16S rRNA processing protein rimM
MIRKTDHITFHDEDFYRIGRLGKPHGVKGEITFFFDDDVFDRTDTDYLMIKTDGLLVPFFLEEYRFKGSQTALLQFCDIHTQEQARQLTGSEVFFPRALSEEKAGFLTWTAMVGYDIVEVESGKNIGSILSIDDTTLNLLFEVHTESGHDLFLPASEDLVVGIDTKKRRVTMRLPEGILDLN